MCVDYLDRCKTSTSVHFVIQKSRGPGTHDCLSWPTKTRQHGGANVPAIVFFRPTWHGAKPRTPPRLIWFLHGFRQFPQSVSSNLAIFCLNLALFFVFILCIHFISSTWQRAKPRTLNIDKVLDENLVLFGFDITYSTIFYFLGAATLPLSR